MSVNQQWTYRKRSLPLHWLKETDFTLINSFEQNHVNKHTLPSPSSTKQLLRLLSCVQERLLLPLVQWGPVWTSMSSSTERPHHQKAQHSPVYAHRHICVRTYAHTKSSSGFIQWGIEELRQTAVWLRFAATSLELSCYWETLSSWCGGIILWHKLNEVLINLIYIHFCFLFQNKCLWES